MLRLLIAPDSFKGSCAAADVANALARGALRAAAELGVALEVSQRPLSDGGEGFLDALNAVLGGSWREASCRSVDRDADGSIAVRWLWRDASKTAYAESARVVGLDQTRVATPAERTAAGIGDLLEDIRKVRPARIVLGVGGTATVDGGATVARALGVPVDSLVAASEPVPGARDFSPAPGRAGLKSGPTHPAWAWRRRWASIDVVCWCDVCTPLLGDPGAVALFAPQKGADEAACRRLSDEIETWARAAAAGRRVDPEAPGSGAGGGIPFGLAVAAGARIVAGGPALLEALDFDRELDRADVVWTGEGALDQTTREGKLVARVLERAERRGLPVVVFAGQIDPSWRESPGGARLAALSGDGVPVERSMSDAAALLERAAASEVARWLADDPSGN